MCLTKSFGTEAELEAALRTPDVAQEDIVVYKRFMELNESIMSPMQGFYYEHGKRYGPIMMVSSRRNNDVGAELIMDVFEGFHSYTNRDLAVFASNGSGEAGKREVILECTVPKGSLYYADQGYVVSDTLEIPAKGEREVHVGSVVRLNRMRRTRCLRQTTGGRVLS